MFTKVTVIRISVYACNGREEKGVNSGRIRVDETKGLGCGRVCDQLGQGLIPLMTSISCEF